MPATLTKPPFRFNPETDSQPGTENWKPETIPKDWELPDSEHWNLFEPVELVLRIHAQRH
jgi:hypothetical protein